MDVVATYDINQEAIEALEDKGAANRTLYD